MTVPQLAAFLQQSAESIRQKVNKGELPGHRLPGGRNIFFFTDDIARILEESRITPVDGSDAVALAHEEPA